MATSEDEADDPMFSATNEELDILLGVAGPSAKTGQSDATQNPFDLHEMHEKLRRQSVVQHVERCDAEIARMRARLHNLSANIGDVVSRLRSKRKEVADVKDKISAVRSKGGVAQADVRLQREVRRLQTQCDKLATEEEALATEVDTLEGRAATLRNELNETEMSRDRFSEMASDMQGDLDDDSAQSSARAQQRLAVEEKIARRIIVSQKRNEAKAAKAQREAAALAEQREASAVAAQKVMAKYVQQSAATSAAENQMAAAMEAAELRRKANNILALKKAQDLISDRDREALRARQQRTEATRIAEAAEKKELLEEGLNPELVLRTREHAAAATAQREKLEKKTKAHEIEVVNKILSEENRRNRIEKRQSRSNTRGSRTSTSRSSRPCVDATHVADYGVSAEMISDAPAQLPRDGDNSAATAQGVLPAHIEDGFTDGSASENEGGDTAYDEPEFEGMWGDDTVAAVIAGSQRDPNTSAGARRKSSIKPLKRGPPSKLEQKMLEGARARQRAGIVRDQVVSGRKFQGIPFAAEPQVVRFDNFEPGKVYRQTITLTNISLSLNNVKMLPPPTDTIEYVFTPVKAMSSGMSTTMEVVFSPRVNVDYAGELAILAQTGSFEIPVVCTTPKCLMEVSASSVDFGCVDIGKEVTRKITLRNNGAIGTSFSVCIDQDGPATGEEDSVQADVQVSPLEVSGSSFTIMEPQSGTLAGHDAHDVVVQFNPKGVGPLTATVRVSFSEGELRQQQVLLKAECVGIPIEAAPKQLVLDVCRCGYSYTQKLTLRNSSVAPTLVSVKVSKDMREFITFQPATFSIAGRSEYSTNVTFKPTAKLLLGTDNQCELKTNLKISVEGQVATAEVAVLAVIVNPQLKFSHSELNLGRMSVTESVATPITIHNDLTIPQEFGFVSTPEYVSIEPGNGVGTLLPGETRALDIICSAPQNYDDDVERPLKFTLTCAWAGSPGEHKINCVGTIVVPPLRLSSSRIKFAAVAVGNSVTGEVMLQTIGTKPIEFAFVLPANVSGIDIHPRSGRVNPVNGTRVTVSHTPTAANGNRDTPRVDLINIPCVCRSLDNGVDTVPFGDPSRVVHLNLFAPVVTRTLELVELDGTKLDFGQVPTGGRVAKTFGIKNVSDEEIKGITTSVQDPIGPFSISTSPLHLAPGEIGKVVAAFAPDFSGKYFDDVEIRSGPTRLMCHVRGSSATPKLNVSLGEAVLEQNAKLRFEACQVGQTVVKKLQLTNPDAFPVAYEFILSSDLIRGRVTQSGPADPTSVYAEKMGRGRLSVSAHPVSGAPVVDVGDYGAVNVNGTAPFYFQPPAGTVKGGDTVDVELHFLPDHESRAYADVATLSLSASGTGEPCVFKLKGTAWQSPMYIEGYDEDCMIDPLDVVSQIEKKISVAPRPVAEDDDNVQPPPQLRNAELYQLSWTCSPSSRLAACGRELRICVGQSPTTAEAKGTKGEFTVGQPSNPAFEVDCAKGVVDMGGSKNVTITCRIPEGAAVGSRITGIVDVNTHFGPDQHRRFVVELAALVVAADH